MQSKELKKLFIFGFSMFVCLHISNLSYAQPAEDALNDLINSVTEAETPQENSFAPKLVEDDLLDQVDQAEANVNQAQDAAATTPADDGATQKEDLSTIDEATSSVESVDEEVLPKVVEEDTGVDPSEIPSLFFTYWQQRAIADAKNSVGNVRPPTEAELNMIPDEDKPKDPGIRTIRLGGIVYEGREDWTIWLNGQRVTPNSVPKEILDLRVFNDYIELKWLDEYTNQVFPIRIRSHQRFNLDARIFLPG